MTNPVAITAFPMHGQHKLSHEGYRTRDGHLIEWFGRLAADHGHVAVLSRPEPWPLAARYSVRGGHIAENTRSYPAISMRMPSLKDRRSWWVQSRNAYRGFVNETPTPVITWNPFVSLSNRWEAIVSAGQPIVFDLLDDWTIHYAFESIRPQVREAYRRVFESASAVTANSEATLELAKSYGRNDSTLLANGCDPDNFRTATLASGPLTVGYVGKIGRRVDLDLVTTAARNLPDVRFVFAGPILDREYEKPLREMDNIKLLGDVNYAKVPELLQTFDIGWVPHRVGEGEVGGDVIKTYEYRAAWLPVLTTPVLGSDKRGLNAVTTLTADQHSEWIKAHASAGSRVPRVPGEIPGESTWEGKARFLMTKMGLA